MFELLAFIGINLLGAISPGPDFAIVTHYGMKGSRRAALLASLGITAALLIHVMYCVLGVAWFLQSSPILFRSLQLLGAAYLGYLGFRIISSSKAKPDPSKVENLSRNAFKTGFFTNLLNPKATLFLLSLFTQFIGPETSVSMKIAFGISIPVVSIAWFSFLSFCITHPAFLPYFQRYQRKFSIAMGSLLILLALSVIWNVVFSR
jgi:RhtB (resistance to homoserine/threonine) family protein